MRRDAREPAQHAPLLGPAACEGRRPRAAPGGTLTPNTFGAVRPYSPPRANGTKRHVEPRSPNAAPPKPPGRLKCSSSLSCGCPGPRPPAARAPFRPPEASWPPIPVLPDRPRVLPLVQHGGYQVKERTSRSISISDK